MEIHSKIKPHGSGSVNKDKFKKQCAIPLNPFQCENDELNTMTVDFPLPVVKAFCNYIDSKEIPESYNDQVELYTICMYFFTKKRYLKPLLDSLCKFILDLPISTDTTKIHLISQQLRTEFRLFRHVMTIR